MASPPAAYRDAVPGASRASVPLRAPSFQDYVTGMRRRRSALWLFAALLASTGTGNARAQWLPACPHVPFQVLRCRDGDPGCDLDRSCDGTCWLQVCAIPAAAGRRCAAAWRFCPNRTKDVGDRTLVAAGSKYGFGPFTVRCQRAARRCAAPAPSCTVQMSGARSGTFACRAGMLVDTGTAQLDLTFLPAGAGGLTVTVSERVQSPGAFETGGALRDVIMGLPPSSDGGWYVIPSIPQAHAMLRVTDVRGTRRRSPYRQVAGHLEARLLRGRADSPDEAIDLVADFTIPHR